MKTEPKKAKLYEYFYQFGSDFKVQYKIIEVEASEINKKHCKYILPNYGVIHKNELRTIKPAPNCFFMVSDSENDLKLYKKLLIEKFKKIINEYSFQIQKIEESE